MFLLDTNVVSELRKIRLGTADRHVARWAESLDTTSLFISAITLHELEIGVLLMERRDTNQGAVFRTWLDDRVLPAFEGRILPIDLVIAKQASKLHVPDPQPINDALIAATAQIHGLAVVTRNVADFAASGVRLINPWDARL